MLTGKIHDLRDLGFSHLKRINSTFTDAVIVNMPHDLCGSLTIFMKKTLENMHDEFHWRVVVVQEQHAVEAGLLRFGFRLRDDCCASAGIVAVLVPAGHP